MMVRIEGISIVLCCLLTGALRAAPAPPEGYKPPTIARLKPQEEDPPEQPDHRAPFVPIVRDRLLFDRYRGRDHRFGFGSSRGGRHGFRRREYSTGYPYYLWWPWGGTDVTIGLGSAPERVDRYYYIYDPVPNAYRSPYYPPQAGAEGLVRLDTPTARQTDKDVQEEAASTNGTDSAFGSKLAPMLGGPRTVGIAFALGEAKLREGQYTEAAAAFGRAVAEAPEDPIRRMALALALSGAGRYSLAAKAARKAVSDHQEPEALRLDAASAFGGEEAFGRVMVGLDEAVSAQPKDVDLGMLRGLLLLASAQDGAAAEQFWSVYVPDQPDPVVAKLLIAAEARIRESEQQGNPNHTSGPRATEPTQ